MTCSGCERDRTIILTTGEQCCSVCDRHRAECEARYVLSMPTKADRRRYLDGEIGNPRRKGVRGMRGDAAVKALETLARAIWEKNK